MNMRTRSIVLYSTLSLAVVGAGGLAYGAIDSSGGGSSTKTATRLVSATVGTVSQTVSASGTVQPATSLDLNFVNGGVLTAVNVKAGQKVAIGQVLGTIDSAKAKVGLESAQANLAAAQQKLDQAKNPTATEQNPSPTVDPVAVAQAKAAVNQAALNVSDAQKTLDATTLKAPAAGTLSAVNFTVGQTVGGGGNSASSSSSSSSGNGSSANSSKSFATLLDLDHMVVKVGFPEADAGKVAAGQPVSLTIDSLPGERLSGSVESIDTVSTVVSNVVTYNAIVAFDSVPSGVKPGMTANVSVIAASRDGVVSVPSAAISTTGGASTVTVRNADGKDETRPVVTGLKGDGTTEITSGLAASEQVVMSVGVVSSSSSRNATTNQQNRTGTVGGGGFGGGGFVGGGGAGGFGGRG
ncbi:MAG: HlyD family efflux transporter periplasmic adaptor subunit [Actinobacteria bacterium]|nr:HlyD family efflux transporter periplasmic adaptor subunit [Actinomycetota bacterium]